MEYDFSGWATKNDLKCSDGRTIRKDAFKEAHGTTVPLVWHHNHDEPSNVLGHAYLENREEGVYTYCKFNESQHAKDSKILVLHGDVKSLSIYANQLVQKGSDVIHGAIREVSLVLTGANPGAVIDNIVAVHSDGLIDSIEDEALITTGDLLSLPEVEHADKVEKTTDVATENPDNRTVLDVFNTLDDEQKTVVFAIISNAIESNGAVAHSDSDNQTIIEEQTNTEGDESNIMKTNVFDGSVDAEKRKTLSHDDFSAIVGETKLHGGSFKRAFLAHVEDPQSYGIENIDYLFPEARTMTNQPVFLKRDMGWVAKVFNGAHHTPFSRIKTVIADITADAARALGYVKGALKKDEVISLLRRTTTPQTVYKKQKLDRDDIVDIVDLDVVVWMKGEMRLMLDEEIARAILVSDGRDPASEDKIQTDKIRPIWTDDDLYAHHVLVDPATFTDYNANDLIDEIARARWYYKGSGNPTMFTNSEVLSDMLLLRDSLGRRIYDSQGALESALRVKEIVEVPVMDGLTRTVNAVVRSLVAIIVNLDDYSLGADKGGAVTLFEDFDIDYNQEKFLMETRVSGALTLPKSALVIEEVVPAE